MNKKLILITALTITHATASFSAEPEDELVSQQVSIVAESIRTEAEGCVTGTTNGTIGYSIKQALNMHTELASATPNVESLFDVSNNCFSGLSQIFDLSFAIPSLGSIIGAASSAVVSYAEKKICSAVSEVTGMVTSPINKAIGNINGYGSITDLNGLTNGLIRQGMSEIDPSLGAQYHPKREGTYTIGTNPFNASQTDFSEGDTGLSGANKKDTILVPEAVDINEAPVDPQDQGSGSYINRIGDMFSGG